jgi:hypothetical protein
VTLGWTVSGILSFFWISMVFGRRFSGKIILGRTVCRSYMNDPKWTSNISEGCVARVDSLRAAGRWSKVTRRTVHGVLVDSPPGPTGTSDSCWLRVFTVGIQTRTLRGVIVDSSRGTRFVLSWA